MPRLLIIDGSNLLFQMFFGMPSRIVNRDGRAIQGTLGFVGALLKIIRMTSPTHLLVLFDGEHENSRSEINPDYKANRPDYSKVPEDKNPFSQYPDILAALDFLGVKHTEADDCEADDLIAGYVYRYRDELPIVISSYDSDLFQLIGPGVSVLRYRGEKTVVCDAEYIRERLGIEPEQYAGFKSLTGDASDNIKGAPGVGPVSAAALIDRFGSLGEIIARAELIERRCVREAILRESGRLFDNYRLIKLTGDAFLPFPLGALEYRHAGAGTGEILRAVGIM